MRDLTRFIDQGNIASNCSSSAICTGALGYECGNTVVGNGDFEAGSLVEWTASDTVQMVSGSPPAPGSRSR